MEENIDFNIWADSSRKITVLPVREPKREEERIAFYMNHCLLFSSMHSMNSTEELKYFSEEKNIDERVKILNKWYCVNDNDMLRLFIKDETMQYLNKCASKFKKSIRICMEDSGISEHDLQNLRVNPYFEVRNDSTIVITSGMCTLRLSLAKCDYYEEALVKEITEYEYYYAKWLRGVDIHYYNSVQLIDNPKGINIVKYTNKSNEEILKLYESIAKYLLSGIK